MNLSIAADLCRAFEGFRPKPYLCPAGIATIGYGSTYYSNGEKVTLHDAPISEAAAADLLMYELSHTYAPGVMRLCPGLVGDEGKFNAIVDFVYNLGIGRLQTSTLRRTVNSQDWTGAREQLRKWVRGGGRILPGLVLRREAEIALLPLGSD